MEDLKLLIDMVAQLPETAVWLLAAYFFYKITIVGSVYGVIRLAIMRLHDVLVARKVEYKEMRPMIDGMCIGGNTDRLIAQLNRLRGVGTGIKSPYIHSEGVDWLRQAIDDKLAKEQGSKGDENTRAGGAAPGLGSSQGYGV